MALIQDFQNGNSFFSQEVAFGHAKKVWRRIEEQLPGGYHVTNLSDFATPKQIRSGMAVVKDNGIGADERDVKVLTWAQFAAAITDTATTYEAVSDPASGASPKYEGWYERSGSGTTEDPYVYELSEDVTIPVSDPPTYYKVKKDGTAPGVDSLGIIGFTQEDAPVYTKTVSDSTVYNYATVNIVVKGELYGYMFGDTTEHAATYSAALKTMTQKNGLNIRVI